jgi:hypothetical protein
VGYKGTKTYFLKMPKNMRNFELSSGGFSVAASAAESSELGVRAGDGSWDGSMAEELEVEAMMACLSRGRK